jgi:alcohol dehydrogenase class IV
VDDRRFEEMAAMAVLDPTAGGNPRRLGQDDALELYQRAYDGRL